MSKIVCQVNNEVSQVEFIWSSHGGFFKPYAISGTRLTELRSSALKTRDALNKLVSAINEADSEPISWELSFELARAGNQLQTKLFPSEDETAGKVLDWLVALRKQSGLIDLEVVLDERLPNPQSYLSVPWNLIYDERPTKAAFQSGQGLERWRPFWAVRYNLTSGRRVDPLRRLALWEDPRVVVVIDSGVRDALPPEQKQRLDGFLTEFGLSVASSIDELEASLEEGYPRLLYWMGHATPEYLQLGDERIAPGDLRSLLDSFSNRERPEGMLAFLNACQTAEAGSGGSFLDVLHTFGFTGAIATEQQTIDTFANEFGLAFLSGFLREGKPLGELLHSLRLERAPLGLIYGAHCPPEIRVKSSDEVIASVPPEIRKVGWVAGASIGVAVLEAEARPSTIQPGLPEHPYRSLGYYDEADRALFTGRDADVVRFAATLDLSDTRIMVLHGESGIGKSSFLRAGVIPYLEHECVGYRFFRRPDGSVLIVQAAKDLLGQLAQVLLDATAIPLRYETPDGERLAVDLRRVLDDALGTPADYATLREALRRDVHLLANVLAQMAGRLPHALVLVLDQAEEVFTLARSPEEVAGRDHGLRMLQRLVDVRADVKLIVSLRTEYYGRLLDYLRAGRRDLTGVRDDLLREFSRTALIEAITRPTAESPLASGQPSPWEKYGFHYAEGIPGRIADGVLAMRSENQDSVLPLVQVICALLYERARTQSPNGHRTIDRSDLEAVGGVEGGLRQYVEDVMDRDMGLDSRRRDAFQALMEGLYVRQKDGTLTTWLKPQDEVEAEWDRATSTDFEGIFAIARDKRLLRGDELRIEGEKPRRYIRLGHDALARVADAWHQKSEALRFVVNEVARVIMVSDVMCQLSNQSDQAEVIWSSRGGFFRPYTISGTQLAALRESVHQTRNSLWQMVSNLNLVGSEPVPWESSYELAEAGFRLFNYLLPSVDETAHKVRRWLEDLRKQSGLIGLEVVVEERSADSATCLSVPWNLVYDQRPAEQRFAFQSGQGVERWRPFWGVRYNLTSGRRVDPSRRLSLWSNPRVVVVVDPTVHEGLNNEQKGRLDGFLAEAGLTAVGSLDELEAALEEGYPRLLYWLGHATPEYLMLGDKRIAPGDLRNLLRSFDDRERPEGMLAFLNANQTAEAGQTGSFLDVLHSCGFTGAIAAEGPTIDNFANGFGLDFLEGFLHQGRSLGELLHGLRVASVPLGLIYGAYCPPDIRVVSQATWLVPSGRPLEK